MVEVSLLYLLFPSPYTLSTPQQRSTLRPYTSEVVKAKDLELTFLPLFVVLSVRLHPDYTPDEIVEKIKLFYAIRDYARDPNQIRPPIKAETGTSVSPPTKESERVANNAIAAEFRKESPFKTLK